MSQSLTMADIGPLQRGVPLELSRSIIIPRRPDDVFAYVSDRRRAHEWRTEVVESTSTPAGPMRLGTLLREVWLIAGDRVVTESIIDAFDPPHRFSFTHVSGPIPVNGQYVVEAVPGGSRLTCTVQVRLLNWWALAAPVFSRTGHGTLDRSLDRLAAIMRAGADLPVRATAA